jgi:ribonuclease P protein component
MATTSRFTFTFRLKTKQISAAFTAAHRLTGRHGIKVLYAANEQTPAKVLIVPTRTLKGHVRRNKLRRQIKAVVYENKLAEQAGTFIVLLYPQIVDLSFDELKKFLIYAFSKKKAS